MSTDLCGLVIVDSDDNSYIGAACHSNNTGELCAQYVALRWLQTHTPPGSTAVLEFDSQYATDVVSRAAHPSQNLSLVIACRRAYDLASASRIILWRKVAAHTGNILNEQAGQLAKAGHGGLPQGNYGGWLLLLTLVPFSPST